MKKIIFIAVSIISFLHVQSQNPNTGYKYVIKVYNLASYYETSRSGPKMPDSTRSEYKSGVLNILHPTLAFGWQNEKGNSNELELSGFELGKASTQTELNGGSGAGSITAGSNIITTNITIRYEYIVNLKKTEPSKIAPSISFGGSPYYRLYKYEPKISSEFPASQQDIGLDIFVTPRLNYNLTSRVFLDINIPICVFDFNYLVNKQDNPEVVVSERTSSEINIDMFPKILSGRIGIGLRL